MKIIGIDPGLSGGIAVLENNKVLNIFDMPVMPEGKKNKRQLNSAQLVSLIKENIKSDEEVAVIVEQVNAMPGQGVTSMFNFGQTFGAIKGVCAALELPIFFVRPSKWKKHFELINSSKDSSRTKAIEMYPALSNQLAKKKDVNKSDAILIARFYSETRLIDLIINTYFIKNAKFMTQSKSNSTIMEQDIAAQVVGLGGATDFSLWKLFLRADFVVKFVIILLIAASIFSWALNFR